MTELLQIETPQRRLRRPGAAVRAPKPEWLKVRAPGGERYTQLKAIMRDLELHTVCEEAHCPNVGECWGHGVATFMILGDVCTRGCRYCAVSKGVPTELDLAEPERVADAVRRMGLGFVVITSVDRDDLSDGGASIFAETVRAIRRLCPETGIELLTPDFQGNEDALRAVLDAGPDILNHNVETVPRLYAKARGGGVYEVTLRVLENVKRFAPGVTSKTGMMLGLGEEREEVLAVMRDLRERGVEILTLGQYLRPSGWHLEVARYVHPDEFQELAGLGLAMGFDHVEAGPLVRSSYRADRQAAAASARARG
ncbi:MAG TPA: lipoyl synthase [Gemmatimonadota bacterium]|jgi:lipoic acid synthetase